MAEWSPPVTTGPRPTTGPRIRAAWSAAASLACRAWLSRRRANRCWLWPPALVRPWTWRCPILCSAIVSPAIRAIREAALAHEEQSPGRRRCSRGGQRGRIDRAVVRRGERQPGRERRAVGRRPRQRAVADVVRRRAVARLEVRHPPLHACGGYRNRHDVHDVCFYMLPAPHTVAVRLPTRVGARVAALLLVGSLAACGQESSTPTSADDPDHMQETTQRGATADGRAPADPAADLRRGTPDLLLPAGRLVVLRDLPRESGPLALRLALVVEA